MLQAVRLFAGVFMVVWAYQWWLITDLRVVAPVMSLLCLAAAIITFATAAAPHSEHFWDRFDTVVFGAILAMSIPWLTLQATGHGYDTDEVTTGQAAASVLLHGMNPYSQDLTSWLHQFNVSPLVSTPLLGGGVVNTVSYPALSFLLYAPLGLVLGQEAHFGQVTGVIAWAATLLVLWRTLPHTIRPLVPVLASTGIYIGLVSGGTTDYLYLPFLMLALWRWPRFGDPGEASPARWVGPVMLGLACAIKQTPWLLAPFLVAGVALEAHRHGRPWRRQSARYAGLATAAFLAPNLPFLLLSPGAWLHGVLLPLAQPLIPLGQGLIQLLVTSGLGGGRLWLFSVAGLAGEIAMLLAFIALYPRSRPALPLLAVVPLALSTRSLSTYFVDAVPPLLVAAASVPWESLPPLDRIRRWAGRSAAVAGALATLGVIGALASPPPLSLQVSHAETRYGSDGKAETTLGITVHNSASAPVRPTFVSLQGVAWLPAWRATQGPRILDPGVTAAYRVASTDDRVAIAPGQTFRMGALLADPASVSISERTVVAAARGGDASDMRERVP